MKVLKFGGSSVGTIDSILKVKEIVDANACDTIVVVSALGGITDMLLSACSEAARGNEQYKEKISQIVARHHDMIQGLPLSSDKKKALASDIDAILDTVSKCLDGVMALRVLPEKTSAEIVSAGERCSSRICATLFSDALLYDSLGFIRTTKAYGKNRLDSAASDPLIKEAFKDFAKSGKKAVVPGFISRDSATGDITNLGRGGSDYTASILAAFFNAEILEIWTDVDGFMTADPRIISNSYVIDTLSFDEAMELCNCGAKVIYAPALYPVYHKEIPVLIKNTFNSSAKGTIITSKQPDSNIKLRPVTGISSLDNISLLTVSGPSLVGILGVSRRLFSALYSKGISVFLISQSSSETAISVGIGEELSDKARLAVDEEFKAEIAEGAMKPAKLENNLAAVAVVGPDIKQGKGLAGKLFSILGRNSISVLACAQGSSNHNVSIIIRKSLLRKCLNVIHDGFFLSEYKELNLFICGIGTVGGQLISQIEQQREKLMQENNLKINIVGIARSSKGIFCREGIDLKCYRQTLEKEGKPLGGAEDLRDEIIGMNIFNSVFVDCTANASVASIYKQLFENGISVVAANKIAASSPYENYRDLKDTAKKNNVKYLFETNVGAGLPIINTINALRNSGDKILKIEAVVSGTLNYIFNAIAEDVPFSQTVKQAKELGFSEPDPRIDLSGKDVIRKLVILAREAGYVLNQEDVKAELFIPDDFFKCSLEEFWEKLPSLDADFERRRKVLHEQKKCWRFVAKMEDGSFSVSLGEFSQDHSFYVLEGSNNIVLLTTERYNQHPMLIQGYGAGASVTAAGVFADIMSIANI